MTFLAPTGSQWRTPEYGRSVIVSSYRGITRVQAWPRKRGYPKKKDQANRLEIFRIVQKIIKWLGPKETLYEREAIAEHNRTHTGQRGSAAIRLRDWQTQRLFGRGVAVYLESGITLYPPAVTRDASFIMDHTTADTGKIAQRGMQQWDGASLGQPGQYLRAGPSGQPNYWK